MPIWLPLIPLAVGVGAKVAEELTDDPKKKKICKAITVCNYCYYFDSTAAEVKTPPFQTAPPKDDLNRPRKLMYENRGVGMMMRCDEDHPILMPAPTQQAYSCDILLPHTNPAVWYGYSIVSFPVASASRVPRFAVLDPYRKLYIRSVHIPGLKRFKIYLTTLFKDWYRSWNWQKCRRLVEVGKEDRDPNLAEIRYKLLKYASYLLSGAPTPNESNISDAEDVAHEVLLHELESMRAGARPMKPLAYLRTAVYTRVIDYYRMKSLYIETDPFKFSADQDEYEHSTEHEAIRKVEEGRVRKRLKERLAELNTVLRRLDIVETSRERHDFFAVFLFHLRARIAKRIGPDVTKEGRIVHEVVELLLPWSSEWAARSFVDGWPPVGKLWAACLEHVDKPPHDLDARVISQRLEELHGSGLSLNRESWYQWVRRACIRARNLAGHEDFERIFLPSLRKHEGRKRS